MKKALITGVTGQDGSYLADFLLEKGYEVYGMIRRKSVEDFSRVEHIKDKINFVSGDLTDQSSLDDIIRTVKPENLMKYTILVHNRLYQLRLFSQL